MTETNDQETQAEEATSGLRRAGTAVISSAQDAADVVLATADRARARLPEAVAGAQVAARDTQRTLDAMPHQTLMMGTTLSLGLGIGLLLSGANRLLVALTLAPAFAMVLTMLSRDEADGADGSGGTRRRANGRTAQ